MSHKTPPSSPDFFQQQAWPFGDFRQGEERLFQVPFGMTSESEQEENLDDLSYAEQPPFLYLFRLPAEECGLPGKPKSVRDSQGFALQRVDLAPWQIMVQKDTPNKQVPKLAIEPAVTRPYMDWYCLPEVIVFSTLPKVDFEQRDTFAVWQGSVRRYDPGLERDAEELEALREDDSVHFSKERKGIRWSIDFLTVSDARKKIQELLLYNSDEYPFDGRESVSFHQATYERLACDVRMKKNKAALHVILYDAYSKGSDMRDSLPMIGGVGLEDDQHYANRVNFLYRFLNESPLLQEAFPEVKRLMQPFHTFDESANKYVLDFVNGQLPTEIDAAVEQVSQELDLEDGQPDLKEISTRVFQKIQGLPEMISILLQMETEYLRSELIGVILDQFSSVDVGPVPDLAKYIGRYLLDEAIRYHKKSAEEVRKFF